MPTVRLCTAAVIVLAGGLARGQAIPEAYTLVELDPLAGGMSLPASINDKGAVVGRTELDTGPVPTQWSPEGVASEITFGSSGVRLGAVAINNEGTMLIRCDFCPVEYAIRLPDGTVLDLPSPPASQFLLIDEPALTDDGRVGGFDTTFFSAGLGVTRSVIWKIVAGPASEGEISTTDIGVFQGGSEGEVRDGILGASGVQVFGFEAGDFPPEPGALRLYDSRTETLSTRTSGVDSVRPVAINASNDIIAHQTVSGEETRAVLFPTDSASVQIDPIGCGDFPGGDCFADDTFPVTASALSDRGLVVGGSVVLMDDGSGNPVAGSEAGFIWSASDGILPLAGLIDDGSADGWQIGPATDINEDGWVIGRGVNPGGQQAAYLLIPRSPCAADANRDGIVTPADFNSWILAFNNGCD